MAVSIESFLVLEKSLAGRIHKSWRKTSASVEREIIEAVNAGKFDDAVDLCPGLGMEKAVEENKKFAQFVGTQAVLFGASRLTNGNANQTHFKSKPEQVDMAVELLTNMLTVNATAGIVRKSQILIDRERVDQQEATVQKASTKGFVTNFVSNVNRDGTAFIDIGSSLHTSRLSSWGFTVEAEARGWTRYQVNEQLDGRTCEVCQTLHGKTFTVRHAKQKLESWLSTTDPDALKSIAKWPSQSKANVKSLRAMTPGELAARGWDTPPYHPMCRGILAPAGTITEIVELNKTPVMGAPSAPSMLNPLQTVDDVAWNVEQNLTVSPFDGVKAGTEAAQAKLKEYQALNATTNSVLSRAQLDEITQLAGMNRNGQFLPGGEGVRRAALYEGAANANSAKLLHNDLQGEARKTFAAFSEPHKAALNQYTGTAYDSVNALLRGADPEDWGIAFQGTLDALHDGKKLWPVMEHDTIVYRGGSLFTRPHDIQDLVGTTVKDAGYKSTTTSSSFAQKWIHRQDSRIPIGDVEWLKTRVLYEMKIPKGYKGALPLVNNAAEMEVLIANNSSAKVIAAEMVSAGEGLEVLKLSVELY